MSRSFHVGERARALDQASTLYFRACEASRLAERDHVGGVRIKGRIADAELERTRRLVLAAARALGRALHNHAAKQPDRPVVGFCPGCKKPLDPGQLGRPRKYHSAACYNLARRMAP